MLAAVALSGAYWWTLSRSHERLRAETLVQADKRATQVADLQAQHIDSLLRAFDVSLIDFRDAIQAQDKLEAEKIVRAARAGFPEGSLVDFSAFDREGYLLYSTLDLPKQLNVGDRDYFKFHLDSREDRLFVDKPVFGRAINAWGIPLSRPVFRQNLFAGVVVLTLSPKYLGDVLGKTDLGIGDISTLLYRDGAFASRSRDFQQFLGRADRSNRPVLAPNAPRSGTNRAVDASDAIPRLFAWHSLARFPLIVIVGLDERALLAPVSTEINLSKKRNTLGIFLILALIAVVSALLIRAANQQKALQESEERFRTLIEKSLDAIAVHRGGKLIYVNPRGVRMMGAKSAQDLIGTSILNWFHPDSSQSMQERVKNVPGHGAAAPVTEEKLFKADGTAIVAEVQSISIVYDGEPAIQVGMRDITERKQLETERAEHEKRFRDLSRRLVDVQEAERRKLSTELHDRTSPGLAAIQINLKMLNRLLSARETYDVRALLDDTAGLIVDTTVSIREISSNLRPTVLDDGGLLAALRGFASEFMQRTSIAVHLELKDVAGALTPAAQSCLFRIVQEALTNCARHAKASNVTIRLVTDGHSVSLMIADDGMGFDPRQRGAPGLGLLTMRERAEFAGGSFGLDSTPGQGTRIEVLI